MVVTTNNFSDYAQIEQARYGRFFKGFLPDGTVAAIKRAQEGSLQGEREFLTEIQLLSRLHHRNLVSLVGYCDEEGEQVKFVLKFRNVNSTEFVIVKYLVIFYSLIYFLEFLISVNPISFLSCVSSMTIWFVPRIGC